MGAILGFVTSPLGRRIAGLAGVAVALALALAAIYLAGVSAGKAKVSGDRDTWRATARNYLASAKAWEGSFRRAESIRGDERAQAERAVSAVTQACDARIATARRSAAAIQSIVTKETRYDESHCPVRAVVGAGELRDALGLAADRR